MKTVRQIVFFGILAAAGLLVFSCTDGEYLGTGGGGEFIVIDRTEGRTLEGKFIEVRITTDTLNLQFNTASPKSEFKNGRAGAPLYTADGEIYAGSVSFTKAQCTVERYAAEDAATPEATESFDVKFYGGSAIVEWK